MNSQRYRAPNIPEPMRPEKSAPNKAMELKDRIVQGILSADDKVQSIVRKDMLGLPEDGTMLREASAMNTLREMLGGTVFAQRPGGPTNTAYRMEDTAAGVGATVASRALQAGVVTAAGAGLMELTQQANAALGDRQEPGQLPMY